jgi:hypothetical protein
VSGSIEREAHTEQVPMSIASAMRTETSAMVASGLSRVRSIMRAPVATQGKREVFRCVVGRWRVRGCRAPRWDRRWRWRWRWR